MNHLIHRILDYEIVSPYTIKIKFDDYTSQTINFRPILNGELYGPLNDLKLFNQVKIDPEVHTLVWPNGVDFDPETLHNWPKYEQELIFRSKKWVRKCDA